MGLDLGRAQGAIWREAGGQAARGRMMVKAWVQQAKGEPGGWRDVAGGDLPDRAVRVQVSHSAINYKDALALTGRSPIFRKFPMVPGIDLAGTVLSDASGRFAPGTRVVATGHGLGEAEWGGYAEEAALDPDWLVALPEELSNRHAAAIGTAGVTAAMAVDALARHGIAPGGEVVVTGPSGGVGGFALMLLAAAGYSPVAATGRIDEAPYLEALGAARVIARTELEGEPRALAAEQWAGGIDVAGGAILANMLAATRAYGAVAACGLASSMALPVTVAPFILRGVCLLGIGSVHPPAALRESAWARLARDADAARIEAMIMDARFAEAERLACDLLDQKVRGRVVLAW